VSPDLQAVVFAGSTLTFRQLDERANRLANHLCAHGLGPERLVGVALDRSLDLVVALLAVLKAGAAYVPIDPAYPSERIAAMLGLAAVDILIARSDTLARLPAERSEALILVDPREDAIQRCSSARPVVRIDPDNLAYAIFTSGSTGEPKGVMISHRSLLNHTLWMQETYRLTCSDRMLFKTSIAFDPSAFEIFWPLLAGATLVVAAPGRHGDPDYLVSVVREQRVTAMYLVGSMMQPFLDSDGLGACTALRL